jgi:hypothetical protein
MSDELLKRKVAEQIALDMDMAGDAADILYCETAAENVIAMIRDGVNAEIETLRKERDDALRKLNDCSDEPSETLMQAIKKIIRERDEAQRIACMVRAVEAERDTAIRERDDYERLAVAARDTAVSMEIERDAAIKERDEARANRRWNIERNGSDLLICEGDHDKGEKCEYVRYCLASERDAALSLLREAGEALEAADELAKDYAWTRQKDLNFAPDLTNDAHWTCYAKNHPVMRYRRARAVLAKIEALKGDQ